MQTRGEFNLSTTSDYWSLCWGLLVFMVSMLGMPIVAGAEASESGRKQITISPMVGYDISGKNDIQLMRSYFQGASWETGIPVETWQRLRVLGMTRLRLINVESAYSTHIVAATNSVTFNFDSLLPGLIDCKKYHLKPHVVVGQRPQEALMYSADENKFGVRDWRLYEEYAYSFMKFVMVEQGFSHADFEVANEPDINGAAWLLPKKLPNADMEMYQAYWQLYSAWARAADKLDGDYPNIKLRLGGPDITPFSFAFGRTNWGEKFIGDAASHKTRMDFFSFHAYGNNASLKGQSLWSRYPGLAEQINYFRNKLVESGFGKAPIYVTEWGANDDVSMSPQGIINGNHSGAAWTVKFLQEMVENKVDEGMALILRDHKNPDGNNNWGWPGLLTSDGETKKAFYNVASMFMKMPTHRVSVSPIEGTVGVIAAADESKVGLIIYNQNWNYRETRDSAVTESLSIRYDQLPFKTKRVHVVKYLIDESHGDAYGSYKKGIPITEENSGLIPLEDVVIPTTGRDLLLSNIILNPSSVMLVEISPIN